MEGYGVREANGRSRGRKGVQMQKVYKSQPYKFIKMEEEQKESRLSKISATD